ncbi:calmodulin-4-like [Haliotis cracherodii]|uniref:calmodulin-4-like n=1 Tax=Haliotis cracherodii TaxID=6455 RepID=UPI0039E7CDAF
MGLLSFCSIAVLLGVAHSQPATDVATSIFNILNTGHKSFITPADYIAYYSQFDKEGKGSISKQDFLKLSTDPAEAERQFTLYDVDKDGALTLKDVKLIVDRFDTDSDGKITLAEFKASYAKFIAGHDNTPVGK